MRAPRAALPALRLLLLVSLVAGPEALAQSRSEPIAVVVSADWPGRDRIDLRTLRRLFLGRQTTVGGRRVTVYQRAEGSAVRDGFARSVLGRSAAQLERYWIEEALLGRALPPRERGSAEALVASVRSGGPAIGYLGQSELANVDAHGLRVLAIGSDSGARRPGDPDYPLVYRPRAAGAKRGE